MSFTPTEARIQYEVLPRQSSTRLWLYSTALEVTFPFFLSTSI